MRLIVVIFHFSHQANFYYLFADAFNCSIVRYYGLNSLIVNVNAISKVLIQLLLNRCSDRWVSHFFFRVCVEFFENSICLERAERLFHELL